MTAVSHKNLSIFLVCAVGLLYLLLKVDPTASVKSTLLFFVFAFGFLYFVAVGFYRLAARRSAPSSFRQRLGIVLASVVMMAMLNATTGLRLIDAITIILVSTVWIFYLSQRFKT